MNPSNKVDEPSALQEEVGFMDTMRTEDDHMADDNPFGIDDIDD